MKKKRYILALLAAMLLPVAATHAQLTLTVANGTVTDNYLPLSTSRSGWQTEMTYPASMLSDMNGASIISLKFFSSTASGSFTGTNIIRITEVASHSPYSSRGNMHCTSSTATYYSGSASIINNELEIELDSTYQYNGGDLVINIFNPSNTSTAYYFYGITYTQNNSGYDWLISSPSWETYTASTFLPKCEFSYSTGGTICSRPNGLHLTDTGTTSATIAWSGSADSYEYQYGTSAFSPGNGNQGSTYDTTVTLSGLNPSTQYFVYVRSICGTDSSSWVSFSFRTECAAITSLPWTENFDNMSNGQVPFCWTHLTPGSSSSNVMQVYNGTAHSGSNALRFNYSGRNVAVLPDFDDSISTLQISFWHRPESNTNSSCGTLQVGYLTNPSDTSTFVVVAQYAYNNFTSTAYRMDEVNFAGAPGGSRIAFRHIATSTNWYWHVDDITVNEAPGCLRASSIAIRNIDSTGAELVINDTTTVNDYTVLLINGNDTTTVYGNDTVVYLTNLTPNTSYTVVMTTNCSDGTQTSPHTTTFRTECAAITSLPWTENFDNMSNGQVPFCWTHLTPGSSSSNVMQVYNGTAHSGSNALRFNYSGRNVAVLPDFDDSISTLQISFWHRPESNTNSSCGTLQVGYLTNPSDTSTFVVVAQYAYNNFTSTAYRMDEVNFAGAPGGSRIAFRHIATSYNWYWHVDDITINEAPGCAKPTAVTVRAITDQSAELLIADTNDSPSYDIMVYNPTDTVYNQTAVSDTVVSLTNLTANTAYLVRVVANCTVDGTSHTPMTTTFRSACVGIAHDSLPWYNGFDSYSTGAFSASCWSIPQRYSSSYPSVSSTYHYDGSNSLYMYASSSSPTIVALPNFDDNLSALVLTFMAYRSYSGGSLEVGVIDNPSDPSTFHVVADCTPSASSTWQRMETSFAGYTTGNIAIRSTYYYYIDSIVVDALPDCVRPSNIAFSGVSDTSVVITINDPNETDSYRVYIGTDSTDITTNTLTIDTLSSNTTYTVSVRTICTDNSLTSATTGQFKTLCPPDTIPYSTSFEDMTSQEAPDCWTQLSGNPRVNTSNAHTGSNYLHFSGATRNMIMLPIFDQEINGLQVHFWTRPENVTTSSCGKFQVGYMTDPTDTTTFHAVATYDYNQFSDYEEKEVAMADAPAGSAIAMLQKDCATNWYWYVDDLTVEPIPACARPVSISIDSIGSDEVRLCINDPTQALSYRYYLVVNDSIVDSNDITMDTVMVSNLTPATSYTIRVATLCSGEVSATTNGSFITACVTLSDNDLPYLQDFNNFGTTASTHMYCWSKLNYYSSDYMYGSSTTGHDGSSSKAFQFYPGYNYQPNFLISPAFDSVAGKMVSFYVKGSSYCRLNVGVMTNAADTTTFASMFSVNALPSNSDWTYYEVDLSSYHGTAQHIAFRIGVNSSWGYYAYIDDVTIMVAPACERPQGVSVDSITTTTAMLHISDTNFSGNYNVRLIDGTDTTTIVATDTVMQLTNLLPGTGYNVQVNTNCTDGTQTSFVTTRFFTNCAAITALPWTETFEGMGTGANGMNPCWNRYFADESNTSTTGYPYASSNYAHAGTKSLQMVSDNDSYYGYNSYSVAYLPEFSAPVNTLQISFWYKADSYYTQYIDDIHLCIGVSDSTGDSTHITRLATITMTDTSWHEYDVDLSSYTGTGNRIALLNWSDASNYYYNYVYIDDIIVDTISSCARPATLTVSAIDTTSATLTWTDANGAGNYLVKWSDGTNADSATVNNTLTHNLTGLTPGTTYSASVQRICGTELTRAREASFRTLTIPVSTLPYTCGFETGDDLAWEFSNNATNAWAIGTATYNTGSRALYISNNNGTANQYNNSTSATSYAYRVFDLQAGQYEVAFDWKNNGENNYDYVMAFAVPDSLALGTSASHNSTPAGWQLIQGQMQGQTTWQHVTSDFTVGAAGRYKLLFMWRNDASSGSNPPAAIDNVSVTAMTCPRPADIVFDSVGSNSITLHWTSVGSETQWLLKINDGQFQTVSSNTYTATGLTANTVYTFEVRALCSATDSSNATTASIRTQCDNIRQFPYTEGFETMSTSARPDCWTVTAAYSASYPQVSASSNVTPHGGTQTLYDYNYFSTYSSYTMTTMYATPILEAPANTLTGSVWVGGRLYDYGTYTNMSLPVEIGVMSNPNDTSTFVAILDTTINTYDASTYVYSLIQINFSASGISLTDNAAIAFRINNNSSITYGYYNVYLDDLTVDVDSTLVPVSYTVSLATADAAMGSVSPAGATTVNSGDSFTATATAADGYHFVAWTENGSSVSTANPYTFTVTADRSLTATFEANGSNPDTYTVTINYDQTMGTVTGAGVYNAGATATLVATPREGYRFVRWSDNVTDSLRTVVVNSDIMLSVTFEQTTGIDNVTNADMTLYPNPAASSVTIALGERAEVSIVDQSGRTVSRMTVDGRATVDLTGMAKGAYYVRAVSENGTAVRKLIVK